MDNRYADKNTGEADDGGGINLLPEAQPADDHDEGHTDARPQGVGNADGYVFDRQGKTEQGKDVAEQHAQNRQWSGKPFRQFKPRRGACFTGDGDEEQYPVHGNPEDFMY